MIEQEPAAAIAIILPATVQTDVVVEAKLTASPELAVAPIINGDTPYVTPLSAPKVTDCDAGLTVKLCATGVAAPWVASPAWLAVIEHEPPATIVTVLPVTVQTDVVLETKLTARPELAVAAMVNGDTP